VPALEKAAELAPNNADCHLKLGVAYLRVNLATAAQSELERAAGLAPENAAIHYQLARLYKQTKQMDKARIEFQRTDELQSRAAGSRPTGPPER
jgi:Tfp pilus assembly protein PilF